MFKKSAPKEDSPSAMTPAIKPRMPWRVASAVALDGFRLRVRFNDGLEGEVDMTGLVHSPLAGVFTQLNDPTLFAQVFVEHGAVTWPGEIDLAPDAMYEQIKRAGIWVLR